MAGSPKKRARKAQNAIIDAATPEGVLLHPDAERVEASVEARTNYIAGLMSELEWRRGRSWERLGKAWGIEPCTVRRYAAEAHRIVAPTQEERDQLRERLAAKLEGYAEELRSTGLHREALSAYDLFGKYGELEPVKRTELTGKDGGAIAVVSAEATPAEARRLMRELFPQVEPHAGAGDDQPDGTDANRD